MPSYSLRPLTAPADGRPLEPKPLEGSDRLVLGRSSEAQWTIPEQAVSRRHASVERHGDGWSVRDLGSRHGTFVNGRRLAGDEAVLLAPGDLLQLGSWACRVADAGSVPRHTTHVAEATPGSTVARATEGLRSGLGQRGLDALLAASAELEDAEDETAVAGAVVQAIRQAIDSPRVLVVRPLGDGEFETLAAGDETPPRVSRSLLAAAAVDRSVVELRGDEGMPADGRSIVQLSIRTAICAPILVGEAADAFLYLDSRDGERELPPDATAFAHAVARLAGLALKRLGAARVAARLQADVAQARAAQQFLMPPDRGAHGGVAYAYVSRAGREVAGDLFDVVPLDGGRVALFLGDVAGKGVGAGVIMAATQSLLRARLRSGAPLDEAVAAANDELAPRTGGGTFVTLLAAVVDPAAGQVEIVDAGHGYGVHAGPGDAPTFVRGGDGGYPIGVVAGSRWEGRRLPFLPGARLIAFSDGVVEQADRGGRAFGDEAALDVVGRTGDPAAIPAALLAAVDGHAAAPLSDDLTVACAWRAGG